MASYSRSSSLGKGYDVGQSLAPVLNNPNEAPAYSSWSWPWVATTDAPYGAEVPPPLAPGILPEVEMADFAKYLRSIKERHARFQAARGSARHEASGADGGRATKQGEGLLCAMKQVPPMYFQEDFRLERPVTYEEVNPEDTEEGRMEKVEELTSYMDIIETNLLKEISVRSSAFFEATGLIQDLETVIQTACAHIKEVRSGVGELDRKMLQAAVRVQGMQTRRNNISSVMEKLKVIEQVMDAQEALQLLLPQGDYTAVLDVLDDLQAVQSSGELEGVAAFRHLGAETSEVLVAVNTLMATEFLRLVSFSHLDDEVQSICDCVGSGGDANESPGVVGLPALCIGLSLANQAGDVDEDVFGSRKLEEELQPLVLGLMRAGQLGPVLAGFRDTSVAETKRGVRVVVEQLLPALLSGQDGGSGISEAAPLAKRLQALRPESFERLLGAVARVVLACLSHTAGLRDAVAKILERAKVLRSRQSAVIREGNEAITAVAEAAHGRWGKLLNARQAVVGTSTVAQLQQLVGACEALQAETEALGGRTGASLRNVVYQQGRAFLEGMHSACMKRLSSALDSETWVVSEVPAATQQLLVRLQARAALKHGREPMEGADVLPAEEPVGYLSIGNKQFHVVRAAVELVSILDDYHEFVLVMPGFGSEAAHRVIELVKVFNSRSCQLVLGAGAMQVAGLKSITAKHLALSCQCLGLFVDIQPVLQDIFCDEMEHHRKALLAPEMGRLLQDLTIHRDEIYAKLVAIMRERLLAGARQLPQQSDKWPAGQGGSAKPRPTAFAEGTAKQLRVLKNVLVPLMNEDDLGVVFGRICVLFGTTVADTYARLTCPPEDGGAWEEQRKADTVLLFRALKEMPVKRKELESSLQPLASFCQRYGKHHGRFDDVGRSSSMPKKAASSSKAKDRQADQALVMAVADDAPLTPIAIMGAEGAQPAASAAEEVVREISFAPPDAEAAAPLDETSAGPTGPPHSKPELSLEEALGDPQPTEAPAIGGADEGSSRVSGPPAEPLEGERPAPTGDGTVGPVDLADSAAEGTEPSNAVCGQQAVSEPDVSFSPAVVQADAEAEAANGWGGGYDDDERVWPAATSEAAPAAISAEVAEGTPPPQEGTAATGQEAY